MGEYIVQLFTVGNARGFPARAKPAKTPRPVRTTFLIRMPPDIARDMRVAAASRELKLGAFTEQLFGYGQTHHFVAWLDSDRQLKRNRPTPMHADLLA